MKKHQEIEKLIYKFLAGELSEAEINTLEKLAKDYPQYEDVLHTHKFLSTVQHPIEIPEEAQFKKMRTSVLRKIHLQKNTGLSAKLSELFEKMRIFLLKPEMAVAALTLIIGFLLGRALPPDAQGSPLNIIKQISLNASENKQFIDVKNSDFRYSNAVIKEIDDDNVSLSFDVTTHVNMVRPKTHPVVREVIAQSLLNPSNTGSELKAISYTENIIDKKIKDALIFTLHNAPMQAVRMKAMSSLMKYKKDDDVQDAFIRVLKEEESVQMRLIAIDYLQETNINPDILWTAVEHSDAKTYSAVLIKAKKYIEK